MKWDQLLGHQTQLRWFQTAIARNRLASTFLFIGPDGVGKRTFARLLAQSLLCRNSRWDQLLPCDSCEDCAQVRASTHPDLIEISKPAEKSEMPLELLIGSSEKRLRQGLCYEISLRPYGGRRKIAIVDDADTLNEEGANALLKTLEEPPEDSLLILLGTSLQKQLPTIRSRCQTILFGRLSAGELAQLIQRNGLLSNGGDPALLAQVSDGSITQARRLSDQELTEFRKQLLDDLSRRPIDFLEISKLCSSQADSAGKDARLKRDRLKCLLQFSADLFRGLALMLLNDSATDNQYHKTMDADLSEFTRRALRNWSTGLDGALACWQTCLEAIGEIDRNVNQTTLLQAWTAKIAEQSGC